MELLVVLVILVLLASLVGPRVIGYLGSSRTKAAKVQIESLTSALELFKLDAGRYPSTSEGLKALVRGSLRRERDGTAPISPSATCRTTRGADPITIARPARPGPSTSSRWGADNQVGGTGENEDVTNR